MVQVTNPSSVLPPTLGTSVYAIACLLAYDGMMGVSLNESVETLTSMVHNTEIGNSSAGKKKANHVPKSFLTSLINHTTPQISNSSSRPARAMGGSSKRRRGNNKSG